MRPSVSPRDRTARDNAPVTDHTYGPDDATAAPTTSEACGSTSQADTCAVNMGLIHLQAGDLVSAYRFFLPLAEQGDLQAMAHLADICVRGDDPARAATWRARLAEHN